MRFKLEIDDEMILSFVQEAASRAINVAAMKIGDPQTLTVDDKTESNEISFSNIVSVMVNASVTMKLRTLELRPAPSPPLGLKEFMESDDAKCDGSS